MIQDALSSLAVVVVALLAHTAAGPWLDPIAALAIGLLILVSAYKLGAGPLRHFWKGFRMY